MEDKSKISESSGTEYIPSFDPKKSTNTLVKDPAEKTTPGNSNVKPAARGPNHCPGKNGEGDIDPSKKSRDENGMESNATEFECDDGDAALLISTCSSTSEGSTCCVNKSPRLYPGPLVTTIYGKRSGRESGILITN